MKLSDYVQPDLVFPQLNVRNKEELLTYLLGAIEANDSYHSQSDEVCTVMREAVLRRESYGSTALGQGVIFPHARIAGFRGLLLLFATCRSPIYVDTPDSVPVSIACLAFVPAERPALALKIASGLARVFGNPEAREFLKTATESRQIVNYLAAHDLPLEASIHARDVCLPYGWTARPDTSIREIARRMLQLRLPGIAVLDEAGRLLGEVTMTHLFRHGLPNFFLQLKSVSFVRDFDPFEQYFLREAESVAGDVMDEGAVCVPENATLMEIIHVLAVQGRAMAHVCSDGKAIGFVDNAAVLNRVLSP